MMISSSPASPSTSSSSPPRAAPPASATASRVPFTQADRQALLEAMHANNQLKSPRPKSEVCRVLAQQRPNHSYNSWYSYWNKSMRPQMYRGVAIAKEFPKSVAAVAVQRLTSASPPKTTTAQSPKRSNHDGNDGRVVTARPPTTTKRTASMEHVGVQTPATSSATILTLRRSSLTRSESSPSTTTQGTASSFFSSSRTPLTTPFSPPRPTVKQSSFTPPPPRPLSTGPSLLRRVSFAALPTRSRDSSSSSPEPQQLADRVPPPQRVRGGSPSPMDAAADTQPLPCGPWDPDASFPAVNQRSPAPLTTLRRGLQSHHPPEGSSPRKRTRDARDDDDDLPPPPPSTKRSKPSSYSTARTGESGTVRREGGVYRGTVVRKAIRSAGPLRPPTISADERTVAEPEEWGFGKVEDTQLPSQGFLDQPLRLSGTTRIGGASSPSASEHGLLDNDHHPQDATIFASAADNQNDFDPDADTIPYQPMRFSGIVRMPSASTTSAATSSRPRPTSTAQTALPTPPTPGTSSSLSPSTSSAPRVAPPPPTAAIAAASAPPLPQIPWQTDPESTHIDIQTWIHCLARDTSTTPDQVLRLLHSVNFNRKRCALISLGDPSVRQHHLLEWMWTPQEDNILLVKPEEEYPEDPHAQRRVWKQKKALIALKGGQRAAWERMAVLMGGKGKGKAKAA